MTNMKAAAVLLHHKATRRKENDQMCPGMLTCLTVFALAMRLASAASEADLTSDEDRYDPLSASGRPKMFVDYLHGPLRGKAVTMISKKSNSSYYIGKH